MLVRGVEAEVLPVCQEYGMGVIPWSPLAGGWLTGKWRKGQEPPQSTRAERIPGAVRPLAAGEPTEARRRRRARAARRGVGSTLIHMALAFVISHPAVTAAIIGPRTMEQLESQLGAVDVRLDAAVLDRIDEIVPPGTTFSTADSGWVPPSIDQSALRRR